MCFGIAWIDIFRPPEPVFSVGILRSVERNYPEVVERALVLRIKIQNGAIKRLRCGWIILRETQIAQSKERFGILGDVGVSEGELSFRERETIRFQRLPPGIIRIQRPERWRSLRPDYDDGRCKEQRQINCGEASLIGRASLSQDRQSKGGEDEQTGDGNKAITLGHENCEESKHRQ